MEIHLLAYFIGIAIVIFSHGYLLFEGKMSTHSFMNLAAAGLIAYYFMYSQSKLS